MMTQDITPEIHLVNMRCLIWRIVLIIFMLVISAYVHQNAKHNTERDENLMKTLVSKEANLLNREASYLRRIENLEKRIEQLKEK